MKITLFYPPNSDTPTIPPSCSHDAFLTALDERDYEKMHYMFKVVSETASVLSDAIAVLNRERKQNRPVREDTLKDFPVYTMTSGGRLWKWNCGWQEFDKNNKEIGSPIGWLAFRKLRPAKKTGDRHRDQWMRLTRPEGPWRRHIDCILNHPLFGNGKVLLTDGHHALFEYHTLEGEPKRAEVIFNTLTEIKVPRAPSAKSVNPVNKSKKEAKVSSLVADLLDSIM